MKIIIQNGNSNPLTRTEMESIAKILPHHFLKNIQSICLYGSTEEQPYITFHEKEGAIGVHAKSEDKLAIIEELIISFAFLSELGCIPKKVTEHKRQDYLSIYSSTLIECSKVLAMLKI